MNLNIYKQKQRWKLLLFIFAVIIGLTSLRYTNQLVRKMSREERKKAEMLAEAWKQIIKAEANDPNLNFYTRVIADNETVPVIVVDSLNNILFTRNLDSVKQKNPQLSCPQAATNEGQFSARLSLPCHLLKSSIYIITSRLFLPSWLIIPTSSSVSSSCSFLSPILHSTRP